MQVARHSGGWEGAVPTTGLHSAHNSSSKYAPHGGDSASSCRCRRLMATKWLVLQQVQPAKWGQAGGLISTRRGSW